MTQDDTFLTLSQSVREQILHRQLHDALYLLRSMIELLTDADDLMQQCTDITEEYRVLLAQAGRNVPATNAKSINGLCCNAPCCSCNAHADTNACNRERTYTRVPMPC